MLPMKIPCSVASSLPYGLLLQVSSISLGNRRTTIVRHLQVVRRRRRWTSLSRSLSVELDPDDNILQSFWPIVVRVAAVLLLLIRDCILGKVIGGVFACYIGEVEGETGVWIGLEVPVGNEWDNQQEWDSRT
ncbi:hypothetical protein PNOK_0972200 [Pyrrhoderma noxium]|uniref:Uncharacterized protein n=1 Tax=Pyrrhoderma noxium TaxID=2282107 RepID=A0A286U4Z6_9AGAM|nr:hypothetical protein PNOK_0972200 [Pyrrhoderma noxium]